MVRNVLLDAGPLVAALDERDIWHRWALDELAAAGGVAATVWPAVTEASWLLNSRGVSARALFDMLAEAEIELVELGPEDFADLAHLMEQYADLPMDLADAAMVHAYAREGFGAVMTVDRRDFSIYRVASKPIPLIAPPWKG